MRIDLQMLDQKRYAALKHEYEESKQREWISFQDWAEQKLSQEKPENTKEEGI